MNQGMSSKDIAKASISGGVFSVAAQAASTIVSFVNSIILARLLLPSDFGIVALANIYVVFVDTISTFGLNMQLIRKERIGDKEIGTNFLLRMFLKFVSVVLMLALVPLLKKIYPGRPQLPVVFVALTFVSLINAMYLPLVAVLKHRMQFTRLITLGLISSIMQAIIAPLLAVMGFEIWSLVIGVHFVNVSVFWIGIWLYRRPWQPVFYFDKPLVRQYLGFGWVIVINKQLTYALDRFDDLWAGSMLGNEALGFYSKAFSLSRLPRNLITAPVGSIFYSAYSRLQNNPSALSKGFLLANGLVLRFNGLFSILLFTIAPEFVLFFLGSNWLPIITVFRLMLIYSFLDPLVISAGYLLLALGRPELQTRIQLIQLAVFIPLVIVMSSIIGIDGIAIAADVMICIGVVALFRQAQKFVEISVKQIFVVPIIGLVLGSVAGWLIEAYFQPPIMGLNLMLRVTISTLIYIVTLILFEGREYRKMVADVQTIFPGVCAKILIIKGRIP